MNNKRSMTGLASALLLGAAIMGGLGTSALADPGPAMSDLARQLGFDEETVRSNRYIVSYRARTDSSAVMDLVRQLGGDVQQDLPSLGVQTVSLPEDMVNLLRFNPGVKSVSPDLPVVSAMRGRRGRPGRAIVKDADEKVPESRDSSVMEGVPGLRYVPYTGRGVQIAVLDSGFQDHDDLWVWDAFDVTGTPADGQGNGNGEHGARHGGQDRYGHGNHVAGIAAGNGRRSRGIYRGVAPDAALISIKVLDDQGKGHVSDVIRGLNLVLQLNEEGYNIRVVNLSLGHPVTQPAAEDPLVQAVERLWDAGIVVVCSAGNRGRQGYGTITSPGNSRKVITVGSMTTWGDSDSTNDIVSTYSSRGPTLFDHAVKPDIIVHGNKVISVNSYDSELEREKTGQDNSSNSRSRSRGRRGRWAARHADYLSLSGTSMAAAVVSGVVALMLEQEPYLDPDTIKARLMRSARKVDFADAFATGAGVVDVVAALEESGWVSRALSPRVKRDETSGQLGVEETGVLWGGQEWSIQELWSGAYIWAKTGVDADSYTWSSGFLWSKGYTPIDAYLWSDGELWSDVFIWAKSFLWVNESVWSDRTVDSMGGHFLSDGRMPED